MTKEELQAIGRARIEEAKKLTDEQLSRRKFCTKCRKYVGKRSFGYDGSKDDGRTIHCKNCTRKARKKSELRNKLIAKEIYADGAAQIVIDRMIAGRELITRMSLAKFLDVSERTLIREEKRGDLTSYNFLGKVYYKQKEVEAWLSNKLGEKIELDSKKLSE